MADVFISYVEEDGAIAMRLAEAIEANGVEAWYFERDSIVGRSYLIQTGQAIAACRVVVLLVSTRSLGSSQVTKEVVRAHEEDKPILPILVDVTHAEFQVRQPEWREAVGAAASVSLLKRDLDQVCAAVTKGVQFLLDLRSTSHEDGPVRPAAPAPPLRAVSALAKGGPAPPPADRPTGVSASRMPGLLAGAVADPHQLLSYSTLFACAQSRWPGCECLAGLHSRGGSEMLLVRDGEARRLVKRSEGMLVGRTAPSLGDRVPSLVDESYERRGGDVYTFRDYVDGVSLDRVVEMNDVPAHGALLSHWAVQVMGTLAQLHGQGIVHRDISPGNIVVTRDTAQALVIDLKSAVHQSGPRVAAVGTQPFVAPEQLEGQPGFASDLYSLGMLLVFVASRRRPPTAGARRSGDRSLEEITRNLFMPRDGTHPIDEWLPRLIALDPEDRFHDAGEALRDWGSPCTIVGCPLGMLSLGDGVAIEMSTINWQIIKEAGP